MYDSVSEVATRVKGPYDRSQLHEVRPGPGHQIQQRFHRFLRVLPATPRMASGPGELDAVMSEWAVNELPLNPLEHNRQPRLPGEIGTHSAQVWLDEDAPVLERSIG